MYKSYKKMIIEKRKRIRKSKPVDIDWVPRQHFVQIENWGEIRLKKETSTATLLAIASATCLTSYLLSSFFIG